MSKHEIEVEGLPEGYEAVAYRVPRTGERFLSYDRPPVVMFDSSDSQLRPALIVKKKQQRRIVLEETDEVIISPRFNNYNYLYVDSDGFNKFRVMREVKETEEPKLCLSAEECGEVSRCAARDLSDDILLKIYNFIKNAKNNNKTS